MILRKFMDENFMLMNDTAVDLYNHYAKEMPIIDYHCHLDPREIYENKRYSNITEVWLYGDHYKWRVMRANGVEEKFVTGGEGVTDYDRFMAWAKTVPSTVGNPLYHWSHLELRRIFGIQDIINGDNALNIWEKANAQLTGDGFSVRDLIRKSNVEVVCTTDDPADSLEYHIKLKEIEDLGFQVLPAFRPDKFLEINRSTYLPWIKKLEDASQKKITAYGQLLDALKSRVEFFHSVGGRVSDHALDYVPYADVTLEQASAIFAKALRGESVSLIEEQQYKTYTLLFLGKLYAVHGWAMQFHMNAHRNNSTRMFNELGPDTGYDSMNDSSIAGPLVKLLDALEREKALPRTILYSLNAKDNDVIGAIIGSFQGDGIPGKIQLGAAWWYNDTKAGMLDQMTTLADMGLLSRFVGMLTDSRSFLSYTRHEYFRRILCNMLSEWVEQGEAPYDMEWLGGIVQNICYVNAKEYFRF
jgi:glucuronate isomerase